MLKWFKSGEQSPAPHLTLRTIVQSVSPDNELAKVIDACHYLYAASSKVHPTYLHAERTIRAYAEDVLDWHLSSKREEVISAFVWAFAYEVVYRSDVDTVTSHLLDVLVANGAEIVDINSRLKPKGIRRVLNIGASRFGEMTERIARIEAHDCDAAHRFLTDRFMSLRTAGYLSWHSTVGTSVRDKFPGLIAYRSLKGKS